MHWPCPQCTPIPIARWWGAEYVETDPGLITTPRAAPDGTRRVGLSVWMEPRGLAIPMASLKLSRSKVLNTLQSFALCCTEAGAAWTQLISPLLQQQPDFPGSVCHHQAPHQLGIPQDSAWPRGLGLPGARTSVQPPMTSVQPGSAFASFFSSSHIAQHCAVLPDPQSPCSPPQGDGPCSTSYLWWGEQGTGSCAAEPSGCCGHSSAWVTLCDSLLEEVTELGKGPWGRRTLIWPPADFHILLLDCFL